MEREGPTLRAGANEGLTEDRFIRPVLKALGHSFTLFPEIPGARRTPDYLFYATEADRAAAEVSGPAAKIEPRLPACAPDSRSIRASALSVS